MFYFPFFFFSILMNYSQLIQLGNEIIRIALHVCLVMCPHLPAHQNPSSILYCNVILWQAGSSVKIFYFLFLYFFFHFYYNIKRKRTKKKWRKNEMKPKHRHDYCPPHSSAEINSAQLSSNVDAHQSLVLGSIARKKTTDSSNFSYFFLLSNNKNVQEPKKKEGKIK